MIVFILYDLYFIELQKYRIYFIVTPQTGIILYLISVLYVVLYSIKIA